MIELDDRTHNWYCLIGSTEGVDLTLGADSPMRQAVRKAYFELTGKEPEYIFSGWGAQLTDGQKDVVERERRSKGQE